MNSASLKNQDQKETPLTCPPKVNQTYLEGIEPEACVNPIGDRIQSERESDWWL